MPLILISSPDAASVTIRDALLREASWKLAGSFDGHSLLRHEDFWIAQTDRLHLHCDALDDELRAAGLDPDVILFASKHRAESGKAALTVHPVGNWGDTSGLRSGLSVPVPAGNDPEPAVGGRRGMISPTDPVVAGRILRRLHAEAKGLRHEVTLEATHHGPWLARTPGMFVEIGTDEAAWADPDLGRRVARAILAAATPTSADAAPVAVALGGSHYAPKATDLVRKGKLNVGHIIPSYALERGVTPGAVLDAIRLTPGCLGYFCTMSHVDAIPHDVKQIFAGLHLGWLREEDL
jgi:D-aminoacyl-tRNA deacylase